MPAPTLADESRLSDAARSRLLEPRRRGVFKPVDAARARFGLLTVADDDGQARIYWLVDLNTDVVEDARFLAFGSIASHAIGDCFCDLARGRSVQEIAELPLEDIEGQLRDAPDRPAFGEDGLAPLRFVTELQTRALAELPRVELLPEPVEVQRYERKREADWDEHDRAWLPLTLLKKIMQAQQETRRILSERLDRDDLAWEIEGLHDDFRVIINFDKGEGERLPPEQRPTVAGFLQEGLRTALHPGITVEEAGTDNEEPSDG